MGIRIIDKVIADLEGIGEPLAAELGGLGHAIAASVKHDCQVAFDDAVKAGKYAADTFVAVGKQALGDYWATCKDALAQGLGQLRDAWAKNGFAAAIALATQLLKNINWRAVGTALTGIGAATLETTARASVQMMIAGVLA